MLVIASGVFTPVVAYMGVGTVEDQLRWRYGPLQSSVGGWHVANSSHNGPWGFEVLPLRIQEGGGGFVGQDGAGWNSGTWVAKRR